MLWRTFLLVLYVVGLIFLARKIKKEITITKATRNTVYFLLIFGGGLLFYFLFTVLFFGGNF
ncbi:hypothetical protein [Enterococcus sp. HY326]|uniref:hypothetical protein n=1 Tax=Enterococcus sp. HY326 TaxID=2971265 RepID=UPI00223EC4BB|nr:hypothetical protein [Enterococcus sp. HY326]